MVDLAELQKRIIANKINKGFNVTDVSQEFARAYGELGEAYDAYIKKQPNVGEEIADTMIYLLGLAEILHIDLESEILEKMVINELRKYTKIDGVFIKESDIIKGEKKMEETTCGMSSDADLKAKKVKVLRVQIIVVGTKEKPYYEIMYHTLDGKSHIGYGSYNINIAFDYMHDCFDIVDTTSLTWLQRTLLKWIDR